MKLFLRKILRIIIFPSIGILALLALFIYVPDGNISSFKINKDINTIFVGDSHIQCSINDSLIPASENIANASEYYYFSYYKLKNLLVHDHNIERIYLGLGYHSLSEWTDRFVFGDHSISIAPDYFFILPREEKIKMIYKNKWKLPSFFRNVIKLGLVEILVKGEYPFRGGFANSFFETKSSKSSMDKRLGYQFYDDGILYPFSEMNLHYLSKIVELCKGEKIELIFLNTPLHEYYRENVPQDYVEKLEEVIDKNDIKYLDLSHLEFPNEYFIPDGDHVSYSGAAKTSAVLKNY